MKKKISLLYIQEEEDVACAALPKKWPQDIFTIFSLSFLEKHKIFTLGKMKTERERERERRGRGGGEQHEPEEIFK